MNDMRGIEVKEGDLIAKPFSSFSTGYLRVGRVTEVIDKSQSIRVEWLLHSEYNPPTRSLVSKISDILVLPDNFMEELPNASI